MNIYKLSKENLKELVRQINLQNDINIDYVYEVYELSFDAVVEVYKANILNSLENVNHIELAFYAIGEYYYSVLPRNKEERIAFDNNFDFKRSMATVVADKFLSISHFSIKERKLTNKYLPACSSLNLYVNFILNILTSYEKNDPKSTLITDLLLKSISLCRCILNLLIEGNETEAFATWRTLHECECTLILLEKYGDKAIEAYLRHMKYALAFKNGFPDKEEQDAIFVDIKATMKEHELKSKDMKKFIEYGWLYDIEEYKNIENFKLNFRDGLEKMAGLEAYNRRYEISSEIIHSTPSLFYAVKEDYYYMSLLSLYESFFRLEAVFVSLFSKRVTFEELERYNNFRKVYYLQLLNIHKREVSSFKAWKEKLKLNN